MTKLSNAQTTILTAAAKAPADCVTTHMQDIKNPMIKQKSLDSMLGKGLINKRFADNGTEIYLISEAGIETVGGQSSQPKAAKEEKPKRETKQSIITALMERPEGATVSELEEATGWQSHSVRGHISNMQRKKGITIDKSTNSDGKIVYHIPQEEEAAA